jgi:DNA-binding PadR family transcriptional regulator
MAKRRRVANLMALAVLGTIVQRPMHPYEMASVLRARSKDQDLSIKWGSLYTVVRNLEKHGLIEATETARQGARPERTVYAITDEGRAELVDWVCELVSTPEREHPRFEAGLSMLGALTPDTVVTLLGQRLERLEEQLAAQRKAHTEHSRTVPRLFLLEEEYELAIREAEVAWVRGFLAELADGSFPGLAPWRAYHETGRIPPELAELAERGSTAE